MSPLRASIPRHQPDSTLPLINIVLLLVLAFMIAGTVAAPLPDSFEPLQSSRGEPEPRMADRVSLTVTQAGDVLLDGTGTSDDTMRTVFKGIAEAGGALSVKADSRAPAAAVMKLLSGAEDAGIKHATVVTIEAKQ